LPGDCRVISRAPSAEPPSITLLLVGRVSGGSIFQWTAPAGGNRPFNSYKTRQGEAFHARVGERRGHFLLLPPEPPDCGSDRLSRSVHGYLGIDA